VGYDPTAAPLTASTRFSSRAGSLGDFLNFLDREAPDLSRRLRSAGPGKRAAAGAPCPTAWRPSPRSSGTLEDLQEAFIRESTSEPAVEAIAQRTNLKADTLSTAML
jgi:hypothetical protein